MSELKRYSMSPLSFESEAGDVVKYEDYKALEQKLESSELKLKEAVLALEEISNMPTHGIMNDNSAVRADKEIRKNRALAQKALAKCNKE